jgi:hypothetical protein
MGPPFLTSALAGAEQSASLPGRFTPWGKALDTYWVACWVDPQSQSGCCGVDKYFLPLSGTRTPDFQTVARRFAD